MLYIIIGIILLSIVCSLLEPVLKAAGKIILVCLKGGAIVLAIGLFWQLLRYMWQIIWKWKGVLLKVLIVILIIIAIAFVVSIIKQVIISCKGKNYLNWLTNVVIGKKESYHVTQDVWNWAKKNKKIIELPDGYVMSSDFYQAVLKKMKLKETIPLEEFPEICQLCSSNVPSNCISLVSEYAIKQQDIIPMRLDHEQTEYIIAKDVIVRYVSMFEKEGAATQEEWIALCETTQVPVLLQNNVTEFASFILKYMEEKGDVQEIDLEGPGEVLYKCKVLKANTKMTTREISLDD